MITAGGGDNNPLVGFVAFCSKFLKPLITAGKPKDLRKSHAPGRAPVIKYILLHSLSLYSMKRYRWRAKIGTPVFATTLHKERYDEFITSIGADGGR